MCNATVIDILWDIIEKKMENKEAFTAFDITMAAKKQGCTSRHKDIKNTIHRLIANNDNYVDFEYDKELIDIPGIDKKAYLYRPEGYNTEDYIPMDRDELYEPVHTFTPVDKDNWLTEEDEDNSFFDE